jgi:hypothetical protein
MRESFTIWHTIRYDGVALDQIRKLGRPRGPDRKASARAQGLVRQGLARRVGVMWSLNDSTKQVAAYEAIERTPGGGQ